jgi:hypothetical protein
MVVDVTPGTSFGYGTPRQLFRGSVFDSDVYHSAWDVHPDGSRFGMVRREGSETSQLVLVLNWIEELRGQGGT